MSLFLVDEDMPRSLAEGLRSGGHDAVDVRDAGLRGRSDDEVFARAQTDRRVLVTGDLGFANVLRFPPGSHAGIVVVRLPNETAVLELVRVVVSALADLTERELAGSLVIVERQRIRRRHGPAMPEAT